MLQGRGKREEGRESEQTPNSEREGKIVEYLRVHGASFFQPLHDGTGGGYPGETLDAIWNLVWRGVLTNDALHALRAYCERPSTAKKQPRKMHQKSGFRSRRTTPPTAQGRWSLMQSDATKDTEWSHAIALQLLARYGVVFRETAHAEGLQGGFSAVYDVLKALEESGRVRRGYFAADLGATQFAMPAAVDLLRSLRMRRDGDRSEILMLAATDPANPYGALMKWPSRLADGGDAASSLTRSVGARVILCDGSLIAYLRRGNANLQVFLPEEEPARGQAAKSLAEFLVARAQAEGGMLIASVNGVAVAEHWMAKTWLESGFAAGAMGFNVRRMPASIAQPALT
jgi:ATP-dependent Lhr-like helicase